MKCLIAEDNQQNYKLLKRMLSDYVNADIAMDGNKALESFTKAHENNAPYDLIFLDIIMPGFNGHEVLSKIRKWEQDNLKGQEGVKIVMATSKDDTDTVVSSYDLGCQHFLMKPYDNFELIDLMQEMGFEKKSG